MFGLSPLFLSLFATNMFTNPQTGLDLTQYLLFLALVGGATHLFGACVLTVPDNHVRLEVVDQESDGSIDETTSLLSGPKTKETRVVAIQEPDEVSLATLPKNPYFWMLFVFVSVTIGCVSVTVACREKSH